MRSSKNRSRSKGNRNRSVGNVVNRVFDSSGPEGKVRGTPQQIIDKYNQLTRDAQLSNDRVAAENFQQHAEHYLRLLSEAQREQEARREQQQQQQQNNQNNQGGGQGQGGRNAQNAPQQQDGGANGQTPSGDEGQKTDAPKADASGDKPFDAVMDGGAQGEGGLVETAESAPKPKRNRNRSRRKPEAEAQGAEDAPVDSPDPDTPPQEAAE